MKKLLLFDFDGTLIDSRKDIAIAVNHVLISFALPPLDEETIAGFVGSGMAQLLELAFKQGREMCLPDSAKEKARDIFIDFYWDHCLDNTIWFPEVLEGLKTLSRTFRMAVLTNKPQKFTDKIILGLGGDGLFSHVIGTHSGFSRKPDPAAAKHVMKETSSLPAETLFIGDSAIDIETAANAGIDVAVVTYGFGKEGELDSGKVTGKFDSFTHLVASL